MRLKQALLCGVLGLVVLTSSGCFLRSLLVVTVAEDLGDQIRLTIDAVFANTTTAICRRSDVTGLTECNYVIDGVLIGSTATFVSELGIFGVIVDPVVLELPAGVTNITGTFVDRNNPTNSGDLIIYRGLNFVPVDDRRTLTAGPGKQLVIVDLPPGAPVDGVDYDFALNYQELVPPGAGSTPIKALLTGKINANNGKVFYPPMLPCTSNMAAVPTLILPDSATFEPILLPNGIQGCDNEQYTYFANESRTLSCDLDNDTDVDRNDLREIMAFRNQPTDPGDPRDSNGDGLVNANDARACVAQCTLPRCAVL